MAAAVELAAHGQEVLLLEAAAQLGGRARSLDWAGLRIDNGQHLFIGAYRETLRLLRRLGRADRLERRALQLSLPDFRLALPRLPAPWHLAWGLMTARGLSLRDKWSAAAFMHALRKRGFKLPHDMTAIELLVKSRQSARLIDALWAPIGVAALNTPLAAASAQVFCNVLRDGLAGRRADSDLLFQRTDLDSLLPSAAAEYIRRQGGEVRLRTRVKRLVHQGRGYRLVGADVEAARVILAVHPAHVPGLVAQLPSMAALCNALDSYSWQPILTLWLRFARPLALPYPMLALGSGQSPWVFDRQDLAPGLISLVLSAEGPHLDLPGETLLAQSLARLADRLGPLPPLAGWKRIVEKRATFACRPGLPRPGNRTPLPGLYLAGDYTYGDYPATLEGAVRSGVECARLILAQSHV